MLNRRTATATAAGALAAGAAALSRLGVAHGQQSVAGTQALAGLIDVVVNNLSVLNNSLNDLQVLNGSLNGINILNNSPITVDLNDVLNGNQINVLSGILNHSQVLSGNTVVVRDVLNNVLQNVNVTLTDVDVLKDFLNNNQIAVDRVIAIDVLSAPVTLYLFDQR